MAASGSFAAWTGGSAPSRLPALPVLVTCHNCQCVNPYQKLWLLLLQCSLLETEGVWCPHAASFWLSARPVWQFLARVAIAI